jgi:hypothetical protein
MFIRKAIESAVKDRFNEISYTFKERDGDYIYGGRRCDAEWVAHRFRQVVAGFDSMVVFNPTDIRAGKYDDGIEKTWHDGASAEHWYLYEKDWGFDLE